MGSGYFTSKHDKLDMHIVLVDVRWEEGVEVVFCRHFSVLMFVMMMMRMIIMLLRILSPWLGRVCFFLMDMMFMVMMVMTFVCLHAELVHRTT
jgi:hypothetical protein